MGFKQEAKKDCFAYRNKGGIEKCTALKFLYCKCEECKFYKTQREMCRSCKESKGRTISCTECKKIRMC